MFQLRCTGKVIKTLGLKPQDLFEVRKSDTLLGDWYVNEFFIDRRKTFIFMNEKTLLSFIIYGVKKSNLEYFPAPLFKGLDQLLALEGFDKEVVNKVFAGYDKMQYTKTASKRVLGNMNDLIMLYKVSINYGGGLKAVNIGQLIFQVNRTPQRNLGWSSSIQIVRELLDGAQQMPLSQSASRVQ